MARMFYFLAAGLCLAITYAHVFLGGPVVVDPIRGSSELAPTVIWLSYFTWHDGTVALVISALAYGYAGAKAGQRILAAFFTLMLAGFGLTGLAIAQFGSPILWQTPAPYAFTLIAVIASVAIYTDRRTAD